MSSIVRQITRFTRTEVQDFFSRAKRIFRDQYFDMLRASRAKEYARILIIIPKNVGNAPKRNKLKRRLKSIFYEEKLYTQENDYAIIARKGAADLSFDHLKTMLHSVIKDGT